MTARRYNVRRYEPVIPAEGGSLSPRATQPDYKINPETGCWEWQKKTLHGYGTGSFIAVGIATNFAHRAYYIAAKGDIPPGLTKAVIDHLCRNPLCVNPDHLELVTPSENVKRGLRAQLSDEAVAEIRERLKTTESLGSIAADYGVNEDTIGLVASGIAWRDDYSAPCEVIRPVAFCRECGIQITTGKRHKQFCTPEHRQRFNSRVGSRRRRAAQKTGDPR